MTTPGGVPNLPVGALTLDTLASDLQDMTGDGMKSRAVARFSSIFDGSTGLGAASEITPFGILTRIFAEAQSAIATADPADIDGPEDLPELLLAFIESLPVVGQFVEILEAILGEYEGEDTVLLAVQEIFSPIRKLLQMLAGLLDGIPTVEEIETGVGQLQADVEDALEVALDAVDSALSAVRDALTGITDATPTDLDDWLLGLITGDSDLDAANLINLENIGEIGAAAVAGLQDALDDAVAVAKNIYDAWFGGSSGSGTPAEVATAVASIKAAVAAGWSVAYFTSSNPTWTVPSGTTQMIGCVINGGGKGGNGTANTSSSANGGAGGTDGGYLSADLDMTGMTPGTSTLAVTVGAAASTAGADGAQSKIMFGATTLLAGAAGANGIASAQGLLETTSQPGHGGAGGTGQDSGTSGSGTAGTGTGSGAAGGDGGVGGAAGAGTGNAGSAGGAGISASIPLCGGAGGGGGAGKGTGNFFQAVTGGAGGNGGFPGGGSGGGGGACNSGGGSRTAGSSGTPGNGLVAILYK